MGTRIAQLIASEEYMPRIGDDEMKRIVKEAIREWMDERFTMAGKWSVYGIVVAALGYLAMAILTSNGWHK